VCACACGDDGRKVRQQEFEEKRQLLEFTESQLNQLTYEIKEEIRQHADEVERKVRADTHCLHIRAVRSLSHLCKRDETEWVVNKAGVKIELLDTVKARKLAYYGHTMRKQGNCLEKEIMQGTMPGARRLERPRMAWVDNIKTWTVLSVEESVRMTEDRDKWRKYVHGMANYRIEDG